MSNNPEMVPKSELDMANNKLEVAKNFLTELDAKVSKYEALGIDELVARVEKYEALGSVEDLNNMKSESEEMTKQLSLAAKLLKKHESDEPAEKDLLTEEQQTLAEAQKEADKAPDLKLEDDESEDYDDSDEDDEDEDEEEEEELEGDTPELKLESAKKKLESYQKLGSVKDIRKVFAKAESLVDSHAKTSAKLESYEEIGSKAEILQICNEFSEMKTKQESERIATALSLPVEKVLTTIEKMESVSEAEKLLSQLFSKGESKTDTAKEKTAKLESDNTDSEKASLIGQLGVVTQKSESENLENLRQLCRKL